MLRSVLLAALVIASATPLRAQERSLDIREFAAAITVRRDGSMLVQERLAVRFHGSWNGIYRTIPLEYRTPRGLNYTLRVDVRGAEGEEGARLRHELERSGRNLVIRVWVPHAEDATRTVTLSYEVRNGLRFFDTHDELYWNVTGDEWGYPIRSAAADVYLPPEASGIRTNVFTGPYGAAESDATVEEVGNLVRFRTTGELGLREGMTVAVAWDPGVIDRPSAADRAAGSARSNVLLVVPFFVAFLMYRLWRRFGRDPELGAIPARYEPPDGLTPAEAGTLIDLRVDMRDITATIVDLAVRGYLRIDETERSQLLGLITSRDYVFVKLMPEPTWSDLKEHERDLLRSLFEGDITVRLSDLQNQFYKKLPEVRDSLKACLVKDGYYVHHPWLVRGLFAAGGVIVGLVIAAFGGWLATHHGTAPLTGVLAGIFSGLVVATFGWFMPARTLRGTHVLRELLGFGEFLERVEKDRFDRIVDRPELFEKYLPFAMAFGVEKRWARAFENICTEPPEWYHGRGGRFHTTAFMSDLGRMSSATSATLASAPRSSSGSSGFGGGGSSGGGFGGGGGGGF